MKMSARKKMFGTENNRVGRVSNFWDLFSPKETHMSQIIELMIRMYKSLYCRHTVIVSM